MDLERWNAVVFWFFLVVLLGFEFYSWKIGSTYVLDGLALLLFLVVVYSFEKKLNLHPVHFFLFGTFLVAHNFGVFGCYFNGCFGFEFASIEFDTYVHFYFGIVSALILAQAYDHLVGFKSKRLKYFALVTLVLGMTAFHELLEYAGGVLLGDGAGFLKAGVGDIEMWDTQTDMRNNLFGALVVLIYYWVKDVIKGRAS
jgi:uncharacterized membrane protein YjdF